MRIGRFLLTAVITASAFTAMAAPHEKNINQTVENISSVINTSLTARSFRLLLRPVH